MDNFDLSKENKKLLVAFAKAHLRIRELAQDDKQRFLLAKIWGEIGFDNIFFWKTVYMNLRILPWNTSPVLEELYNLSQNWYHQYSLQEMKKNQWLNFVTMDYANKKKVWNDFWTDKTFIS